jgi:hypothetical protein
MTQPDVDKLVGTPEQLVGWLKQLPTQKRYRLVEVTEPEPALEATPLVDPKAAASLALLQSWIDQAPTDPEAVREAEADLLEFKRNMNLPRKEAGARLHYPEAE